METAELILVWKVRLFWALWFQWMISLWDAREQQESLCVYINIPRLNMYTCCHSHRTGTYIHHLFLFVPLITGHVTSSLLPERGMKFISRLSSLLLSISITDALAHTHTLLQLIKHWSGLQYCITSAEAPEVHLGFNQVLIRVLM